MKTKYFSMLSAALFGLAGLVNTQGCSSDDTASNASTTADSGADSSSTAVTETKTVGAAGGTFTTSSGVTIEVPAGAVSGDTAFTVTTTTATAPAPLTGTNTIGDTYEFGPSGVTFAQPVKVTLPLPAGAPTSNVVLVRLPSGGSEWLPIGGLEAGATSVTGYTKSFSQFRLVQMVFEQAGCFAPTDCNLVSNAGTYTGTCSVAGTSIAAGATCAPSQDGRIACTCNAGQTGLSPQNAETLYIDYATLFNPAVALYQVASRCGWPCNLTSNQDGGQQSQDSGTTVTDAGSFNTDAGYVCAPPLVISQIYTHGGLDSLEGNNDWVQLHNRENTPVSVDGLALQVTDGNSTMDWNVIPLTGTIPAGGFYLVQLGRDAEATGMTLPTPDATGAYNLPLAGGRIALTVGNTPLTGTSGFTYLDGVAYGSVTFTLEGSAASAPPNPGYVLQRSYVGQAAGCGDTNVNKDDFQYFNYALPSNSASTPVLCPCSNVK